MGISNLFMRKQRYIQGLIGEYMDTWRSCVDTFHLAWEHYLADGISERFRHLADKTHKDESRADDLRRRIELELYAKALLPESRGDLLGILETVDRLLSNVEWTLLEVQLEQLVLPDEFKATFKELGAAVHDCCVSVDQAIRALLLDGGDAERVLQLVKHIDEQESEADHLERTAIRAIFAHEGLAKGDKLQLKQAVRNLAAAADQGEAVSNRLMIASVKRRV